MTLDPKVRELLDLAADAPPIGTVPVEVMRGEAPSQMATLFRMGLMLLPGGAGARRDVRLAAGNPLPITGT